MIGVLGGTGNTGGQVVKALQGRGVDFKCIVRNPDAAREKLGAEVALVQGDLSDRASLDSAFQGIDTLYLLCGHSPNLLDLELNALDAAKDAGVTHIVKSSGSEKGVTPDSPSEIIKMHYHSEQAVMSSGIAWTIARPNFFISNLRNMAEPIAKMGKLITALPPETQISMIHPADVGESAAELLISKSYVGEKCFLTGKAVTLNEVKDIFSKVLGKDITYVQVSPDDAREAMQKKGMPDWLIAHMGGMMGLVARGEMAGVTDWVKKLTGHEPRTAEEWITSAKNEFS